MISKVKCRLVSLKGERSGGTCGLARHCSLELEIVCVGTSEDIYDFTQLQNIRAMYHISGGRITVASIEYGMDWYRNGTA